MRQLNVPLKDATAEADSAAGPSSTPTVSDVTASVTFWPASNVKSMEVKPARCGLCSTLFVQLFADLQRLDTGPHGIAASTGSAHHRQYPPQRRFKRNARLETSVTKATHLQMLGC